ncbi:Uncharacterized protein APZ42_003801 [Daphnia magna]|uniref:Uncharacterized protein n=1 Tax=Daphnia magna TaxID=35525 RepID=A0A162C1Y4_9CRUS|nr:Uncharacterized protein APZ42_003801 [Daphnia magna]
MKVPQTHSCVSKPKSGSIGSGSLDETMIEESRGERGQLGHGSYWTKTLSATCYRKKILFLFLYRLQCLTF